MAENLKDKAARSLKDSDLAKKKEVEGRLIEIKNIARDSNFHSTEKDIIILLRNTAEEIRQTLPDKEDEENHAV